MIRKKWRFHRTVSFPLFRLCSISDCPKLPEKLEIDGRDVSADQCSFISDATLSGAKDLTIRVYTYTRTLPSAHVGLGHASPFIPARSPSWVAVWPHDENFRGA